MLFVKVISPGWRGEKVVDNHPVIIIMRASLSRGGIEKKGRGIMAKYSHLNIIGEG